MTTLFHPIGEPGTVAALAVIVAALNLPLPCAALPFFSAKSPVVVRLPADVNSEKIQQALDNLPAAGGEVVLPAGEFPILQPIVLQRSHQTLRGAGDGTILRLAADANCPVIIMGEPVNDPKHTIKHLWVRDLFIDGNRLLQQRELWRLTGEGSQIHNNGIAIQDVSDSLVENVTCADCRSGGLVTTRQVRRLTVRHLTAFENQFDGLACYQTEHCRFTDLYLHDNPDAGISLDLGFNDNVISNAVLVANDLGVFMRASRNNQFWNVSIRGCHHYGVFMAQTVMRTAKGWREEPQTACTDNAFTNLNAANCGGPAFRVNNVTCTNNVIIRPIFAGNRHGGLSLARANLVTIQ